MLGKIIEFICIYAVSSGKIFESSSKSMPPSSVDYSSSKDDDEKEWVPNYMKPLTYDDDDDD